MILSPKNRIAGLLAPLFAIRSENDLGIGDTEGLRQLVDWAAEIGFSLVQLLPITETGADNSPYMAVSSVAIEPATLCVTPEAIPDLPRKDYQEVLASYDFKKIRSGPVLYPIVKGLKLLLLERAFDRFCQTESKRNSARAKKFLAWTQEQSAWLDGYTLFRVLMDENKVNERWDLWPSEQQTLATAREWLKKQSAKKRRQLDQRMRFFSYVQWLAFAQWHELKNYADRKGVALMGDVPFGISYYSADVFSHPDLFDLKWSGGAPPEPAFQDDLFTVKWGQNWGIPLYRWDRMREDGFAWWRQRVRAVREMFHLFRIDHVLGFYRIYGFPWRPQENSEYAHLSHDDARTRTGGELPHFHRCDDSTEENRAHNCRQGEEFLKALLAETGEHRLIGEDLGTVPPYVRPNLTSLGIAGFKIPIWEKKEDGWLIDGADYQRLSLVTFATHDHEPIRSFWERSLRELKEKHGHEREQVLHEMRKFAGFAHLELREPQPWSDELHEAFLRGLFRANSWIAVCMITDLLATEQRFNIPGAIAESNWSTRLPLTVNQWRNEPETKKKMQRVRELLHETDRLPKAVS